MISFVHIPWIPYMLQVIIKCLCGKSSIQCNFNIFQTRFWQLLVQYHHLHTTCTCLLKYVDFLWDLFFQHKLLAYLDKYVFSNAYVLFWRINTFILLIIFIWTFARIKSCPLYRACTPHCPSNLVSKRKMRQTIKFLKIGTKSCDFFTTNKEIQCILPS